MTNLDGVSKSKDIPLSTVVRMVKATYGQGPSRSRVRL